MSISDGKCCSVIEDAGKQFNMLLAIIAPTIYRLPTNLQPQATAHVEPSGR